MKICTKCKIEQPLDNFHRRNDARKRTHQSHCKECRSNSRTILLNVIPDLEGELWLPLVGYGKYIEKSFVVSNLSRIRRIMHRKNPTNRLMTQAKNKGGYWCLSIDGKKIIVSRAVALAFIPNPDNLPEVNHVGLYPDGRQGNKDDNRAVSLRWSDRSDNAQHAYEHGLSKPTFGSINGMSKLTEEQVLEIRAIGGNLKQCVIADIYNIKAPTVSEILSRKKWKHI